LAYGQHGWNAVKIDKHWYTVDVTHQSSRAKRNGRVEIDGVDRWTPFLLIPERTIYSHLPKNEKHQFLKTPIDPADHERLPFLQDGTRVFDVKPISHPVPVVLTRDELLMTFEVPKDVWISANLHDDKGGLIQDGAGFLRRIGKTIQVRLPFSKVGTYGLHVVAKKRDDTKRDEKDFHWEFIVRYRLEATAARKDASLPDATTLALDKEARVIFPQTKTLKVGEKVPFLVHLPGATQAAVI